MTRTEISIDPPRPGEVYYLIIRARTSQPQISTRQTGADVDTYSIRCTTLAPGANIPESGTQIVIQIGDLPMGRVEAICAHLADSNILRSTFQVRTDAGSTNARVVDPTAIDAIGNLVDHTDDADLPATWTRYRVHDPGSSRPDVYGHVGDTTDVAHHASCGGRRCVAVWPVGYPYQVMICNPFRYLANLTAYREAPPAGRRPTVIAAWNAGLHNVRAIAAGVNAHRSTVYADLRSVGIEPTDRE